MSPFELYLILKLDAICEVLMVGAVAVGIALVISLIFGALARADDEEEMADAAKAVSRRCAFLFVPLLLAAVLIPTTKQVAAIYVLSALTQDETVETIKSESGELYDLFKAWLRTEIGGEVPAPAGGEETPNG